MVSLLGDIKTNNDQNTEHSGHYSYQRYVIPNYNFQESPMMQVRIPPLPLHPTDCSGER